MVPSIWENTFPTPRCKEGHMGYLISLLCFMGAALCMKTILRLN